MTAGQAAEAVGSKFTPEGMWQEREDRIRDLAPAPTTYAGRTFAVADSELRQAFTKLHHCLLSNNVRFEYWKQERHEKKGYKRRRLASERWRRRFAHEVRRKVQIVNEIRARGA